MIGFILYPKSPRYVEPETVWKIVAKIKEQRAVEIPDAIKPALRSSLFDPPRFIGVFVNESLADVRRIMGVAGLDYAQLHGNEDPSMLRALAGRAYKALRPASAEQALIDAERFALTDGAPGPKLMVDAYDTRAYGGTGKKTDWTVAADLAARYPGFMLAGGLTPDNVADAVTTVQPWAVDVASGVEASPGCKDHEKVRQFILCAKRTVLHTDNR
jgi:phosphoribosylanthranilate isomerase